MEILNATVKNLAIILLLAVFLEMLLPSRSMFGFVKLIMGLFVISAVLGMVGSLLHLPLETSVPAWQETGNRALPVLASGNEGKQIGKDAVQEQYRKILQKQIEVLAKSVPGVINAEVQIELSGGSSLSDQPQINRVEVAISEGIQESREIEKIVIADKKSNPRSLSQRAQEVRNKISAMMQLREEKIIIKETR